MSDYSKELIAASTIPIVLEILKEGDNYGYAIIKKVQQISGGSLNWKEGTLYPVLAKLEERDLIQSYHKEENGRLRKYYRLKPGGRKLAVQLQEEWTSINTLMSRIWNIQKGLTWMKQ